MKYITNSLDETILLGKKIGSLLKPNTLIAMNGDLAAGKTSITKGIGQGLGVKTVINSPTFNILKIYQGDLTLYHIDAYRLAENPYDLGFDEYVDDGGVMIIEWFDYIKDMMSDEYLEMNFKYIDDNSREIEFIAHGLRYEKLLKEIEKVC